MQKLGDMLYLELRKSNKILADKVREIEVLKTWSHVFGRFCPEMEDKTMATSFKGGVLNVAVLTKEAADAIQFCRARIMEGINEELGRKAICWISCEI